MAVKAIGKENVLTVSMPCNSKKEDFEDAKLVSEKFGVELLKVDLSNTYKEFENVLNSTHIGNISKEASINAKPRLRMTSLYAIAQTLGYLVIGTGNLSEAMVRIYNKMGRQWI